MLYDLRRADVRIKWLVTGLLATLGLSYVFGAVMVALYAGFTPQSVAATYASRKPSRHARSQGAAKALAVVNASARGAVI